MMVAVMTCYDGRIIRLNGEKLENVRAFRYLASVLNKDWSMEEEIQERVQLGK